MKTIEPCPFCGSDYVGIVYRWTVDHKKQFAVWCYECENHTLWCPKKEMAVAGWDLICERAKVVKPMAMGTTEKSSTVERTAKVIEHDASITDTDG